MIADSSSTRESSSGLHRWEGGDNESENSSLSIPKSKCTSPTNLTTLFENVPSSQFEIGETFNRESISSSPFQKSSSLVHLNSNSSEKLLNS